MIWQVLDVKAIWIKEFASALAKEAPVLGWLPQIENFGVFDEAERGGLIEDPPLSVRHCALQRGFARAPLTWLAGEGARLTRRMLQQTADASTSPLVCTAPHYAAVAKLWPGPVIYYVTDLIVAYGERPQRIKALDRRMCRAAHLVCPNSQRIADYLIGEANCAPEKIQIVPNATRAANLLSAPLTKPSPPPPDASDLRRPLAGVIGNMAANIDWELIEVAIALTPWLSWVFVGPAIMDVPDSRQFAARRRLLAHGGRVRFVGSKPYGELRDYARALDVAVLPYRRQEPTYSGSSTRFYEHLATCRPMISTRGFAEVIQKVPLVQLADNAEGMARQLEELRGVDFRDGHEEARWRASRAGTWEVRAQTMVSALAARSLHRPDVLPAAGKVDYPHVFADIHDSRFS